MTVSWDRPGKQTLFLWRDIDSTTRPYIPFQFFEFEAAPPISVNIAPTNVGKPLTYELTKPIAMSESRPLFVGVRRSGEEPGFLVASSGEAAPGSIVETIDQAEAPRLKSILSRPAHPFTVSISTRPATKQPPWFKDVTKEEGLDNVQSSAITWADLDGDGADELIVSGPRIFKRVGGKFVDATTKFGLGPEQVDATLAADLDQDGDLDLVCLRKSASPSVLIFKMESGKYVPSPYQLAHTPDLPWCANIFDFDGDGHEDIFVGAGWDWNASRPFGRSRIWRNNGKGEFIDVSDNYGFDSDPKSHWFARVSLAIDFWQTNQPSLFVGTYYLHPDRFWSFANRKATDLAARLGLTGIQTPGSHPGNGHGLGVVAMDINQDGWLDLLLANLIHPDWRGFLASNHSQALINDKKGGFSRMPLAELGIFFEETAADLAAADFDGDGFQDLFQHSAYHRADFYKGVSGGFSDYTDWSGVRIGQGTVSAVTDFNRDGMPDLAAVDGSGSIRLFQNIAPRREMVSIKFMSSRATSSLTATIPAHGKLPIQVRTIAIGRGSANQDSLEQWFAIDRKNSPKINILWPSGKKEAIDLQRSAGRIQIIEASKSH